MKFETFLLTDDSPRFRSNFTRRWNTGIAPLRRTVLVSAILVVASCSASGSLREATLNPDSARRDSAAESEALSVLLEDYFEAWLKRNPIGATSIGDPRYNDQLPNILSDSFLVGSQAFERHWLSRLRTEIDRSLLQGQDALSYDVFRSQREEAIASEQFPEELLALNQMTSFPNFLAQLGSGQSLQPFNVTKDYEDWLLRARAAIPIFDQIQARFREGIERGVVQPKIVMKRVLPQLAAHVVEDLSTSTFMMPVKEFPDGVSESDHRRIYDAYASFVEHELIPAYKRLHDFIRNDYMPFARDTHGHWDHPNGEAWYAFLVRQNTTTDMKPDEIHALGLAEVRRIHDEMRGVMKATGFEGDLQAFFDYTQSHDEFYYKTAEELLQGYRDLQTKVNERLPKLFDLTPKADYEVREVEAFMAKSSPGASYQSPSPDGSRPGIFYVNTYNLRAQPKFGMETLSLHEAAPGHHFQISIAQEIEAMPKFRRFGGYTAYVEGWALYAESIGKELGMFEDPMQYYGRLSDELFRAMRLVVDTGLHSKRWTREEAIAYMLENSSMAESDITAEVERYIAIPGQALSYKVGQLAIQQLRERAERELAGNFDVREFHREILVDGALPLPVLEAKIGRWIQDKKLSSR